MIELTHRDARFNRTFMAACFLFLLKQPGMTMDRHAALMRATKERFRRRNAKSRRDAEGARQLEAMEDRDPSITPMIVHIANRFMREVQS